MDIEIVIRERDDMQKEYGLDSRGYIKCASLFTPEMNYMCGQTYIVDAQTKTSYGAYHLNGYAISKDMICKEHHDTQELFKKKTKYYKLLT